MKIYVYDMTDFEKDILEEVQSTSDDEITLTREHLSLDTLDLAKGYDGVSVLGYSKIDRELLEKMKEYNIMLVATRTIGYDHFDVAAAKELGIKMYNAYYSPNNVADFAVMMMLVMLRKAKISICRALVNDFSLDDMMGREMRSLTIGIIGTGKIGSTVIKNLSGFGCKIIAYDKFENPELEGLAEYVDLDTLYASSDMISLHVPLLEDNYHMINYETIHKMKPGVVLINTARGALINTEDLIRGLEEHYVGGAAVDTVEEEMGVMHVDVGTRIVNKRSLLYLKQFPNVLYTQHYGFFTEEAVNSMINCSIEALQAGFAGKPSKSQIKM